MDKVLYFDDFVNMDLPKKAYAVFGFPINHSLSPVMQNEALSFLKIEDIAKYFRFEVKPENLSDFINFAKKRMFSGINFTIPLKEEIIPHLSDMDSLSKLSGACNTVKIENGLLYGYNTDGFGLENSLKVNFGKSFWQENVLIYGAGGAAKAVAFAAAIGGAKKVFIANRTQDKAKLLAEQIRDVGYNSSIYEEKWASKISVIINATSIGLKDSDSSICDFSVFNKDAVFCDMVYAKNRKIASVESAQKVGIKACNGLSMLAWQGAKALQIWLGFDDQVLFKVGKVMTQALERCTNE